MENLIEYPFLVITKPDLDTDLESNPNSTGYALRSPKLSLIKNIFYSTDKESRLHGLVVWIKIY